MGHPRVGKVLATCVSERTGTVKRPVASIMLVRDLGVVGDAHAGKLAKRQVSLLSVSSIEKARSWGLDVAEGSFAENVTLDGLSPENFAEGDVVEVGGAVLRVTQIGKECHADCEIKRLSSRCVMPAEGIFAEVLVGGVVTAGDVVRVRSGARRGS